MKKHSSEWGYKGEKSPKYWAKICPEYAECNGKRQSPVNIIHAKEDPLLKHLSISYNATKLNVINNTHTIQFNVDAGSEIAFNNKNYQLIQFHFHASSEHTVEGNYYPLEIHFVHQASAQDILVTGIFIDEGPENPFFTKYLDLIPVNQGVLIKDEKHDMGSLIPQQKSYYYYKGSLTTPPCSEIVNWIVFEKPIFASKNQIQKLSKILDHNFRPVLPLNGRKIGFYKEVK